MEAEEGTDIRGGTSKALHGDPIDGSAEGVVEEETGVHETEEPCVWWSTGPIKDDIGGVLDGLDASFSRALVLLMGFTLPGTNVEGAKDVQDPFACLRLGLVRDESVGSTTVTDDIFQGIDKFFLSLHAINIGGHGSSANKELSSRLPTKDGWGIREDSVRGKVFIAAVDIEGRMRRFEMFLEDLTVGHSGILSGQLKGAFDDLGGKKPKERTKEVPVAFSRCGVQGR